VVSSNAEVLLEPVLPEEEEQDNKPKLASRSSRLSVRFSRIDAAPRVLAPVSPEHTFAFEKGERAYNPYAPKHEDEY
jgi:hypothetical protein